jgi:hypothetical protein
MEEGSRCGRKRLPRRAAVACGAVAALSGPTRSPASVMRPVHQPPSPRLCSALLRRGPESKPLADPPPPGGCVSTTCGAGPPCAERPSAPPSSFRRLGRRCWRPVPIARLLPVAAGRQAAVLPVPALHRFDDPRARPDPLRSPGRPGWLEAGSRDGLRKRAEASDDRAGARPASPLGDVAGRAGMTSGGVRRRPVAHTRGRSGLRRPLPDPQEDQLARPQAPVCACAASASRRGPGAATAPTGRPATVVAESSVSLQPLAMPAPIRVAAIDIDRRPSETQLFGDLCRAESATLESLDLLGSLRSAVALHRHAGRPPSGSPRAAGAGTPEDTGWLISSPPCRVDRRFGPNCGVRMRAVLGPGGAAARASGASRLTSRALTAPSRPLAATALQRRSDPAGRDGPRRATPYGSDPQQTRLGSGIAHQRPGDGPTLGFPAPGFESPWRYSRTPLRQRGFVIRGASGETSAAAAQLPARPLAERS